MASKRMIAKSIVDSDNFLEMPTTAQLLYFHLLVRGDDEGFIDNPRSIMRNVRCTEDDMRILIAKQYIIPFDSGIIVIKHWKIHNHIRKDRIKNSEYVEERAMLSVGSNDVYQMTDNYQPNDDQLPTICQPNDSHLTDKCQARLVENSIDKSSRDKEAPTSSMREVDEKVIGMYQDNIHPITPLEMERLADDIDQYGVEWCMEAIKRAVMRNKRTLGYIEGILRDWATNGYDDGEKKQTEPEDNRPEIPYVSDLMAQFEEACKC